LWLAVLVVPRLLALGLLLLWVVVDARRECR
jgi:hypothetical protein